MAAITSSANTSATEMDLISQIVQTELLENTVVLGTCSDHSDKLVPGVVSIDLPRFEADTTAGSGRFGGPSAQNVDGETGVTFKTASLTVDTISLNQWQNLPYRIPDRVAMQSRVPLEAELARKAGQEMAIYMDQYLISILNGSTNTLAYNDTTNEDLQLDDIVDARMTLNRANVPMSDRYLLISPEKERDMLNISNFIKANEYGSREALLNGEIGQVFGFRVLVSNLLTAAQAFAYHKEAVAYAIQHQVDFESQRADVNIRATDYSYAIGWGAVMTYDDKKCVKFVETA